LLGDQRSKSGILLLDPENVFITGGATSNGGFDNGNPDKFTPTGDDSVLNVTDLQNALAGANVVVSTGATGSQAGDITVAAPVTWSANTLTLDAYRNIDIDAHVLATGTAGLALITADRTGTGVNDGNSADGDYFFNNGGHVTFANTSEAL